MLKHVSYRSSSASLSRTPCDYTTSSYSSSSHKDDLGLLDSSFNSFPFRRVTPDNVSLTSALSFSSLAYEGRFCSRTSSVVSLNDQATVPVKIYLRRLRPDMQYKTVSLSLRTTCGELVRLLLSKFRLRHRDPNLFFVLMEVSVRAPCDGAPVKRQLVLEPHARPAELQQCRPKGEANFSIGVRRGGLLRVHDSILMPGSQYKSLMVSYNTCSSDVVQLLLNCYNSPEDPGHYCLHETCKGTPLDRALEGDERPLEVQARWPAEGRSSWVFVLRRNISYTLRMKNKVSWRRSLGQSSSEDAESELDEHNTTRASLMSSSSTLSSSSSNSSRLSSSSGVSSDVSSTCSDTSGVSSSPGDLTLSSPESSPAFKASLTPSRTSISTGKPPRPVPRTLFPDSPDRISGSTRTLTNEEEDSGIVMEDDDLSLEDFRPELHPRSFTISSGAPSAPKSKMASVRPLSKSSINLSSHSSLSPSKPKSSSFLNLESSLSSSKPESSPTSPKPESSYLNHLESSLSSSKPKSSSSLNLESSLSSSKVKSSSSLNLESSLSSSKAKSSSFMNLRLNLFRSEKSPLATSTPKVTGTFSRAERRYSVGDLSTSSSPLKLTLVSSPGSTNSPCSCKSCFYI